MLMGEPQSLVVSEPQHLVMMSEPQSLVMSVTYLVSMGGEPHIVEAPGDDGWGSGTHSLAHHVVGPPGTQWLPLALEIHPQRRNCGGEMTWLRVVTQHGQVVGRDGSQAGQTS